MDLTAARALDTISLDQPIATVIDRARLPLVFVDVETTGLGPDARVIEVAAIRYTSQTEFASYSSLVDPEGAAFEWKAMGTHHLTPEDLVGAPPPAEVARALREFVGAAVVVAHNAPFDRSYLGEWLGANVWLDSLRLSRHVWPEAPTHTNWGLFYGLELHRRAAVSRQAHRALSDVAATGEIAFAAFERLFQEHGPLTLAEILPLIEKPVPVTVLRCGKKHWGQPIAEIETSYLHWMSDNFVRMDDDTRAAVRTELERRCQAELCSENIGRGRLS